MTDTQPANSNELLDRSFPKQGKCAFCGRQDARHRVLDAIKDRHKAGDSIELLAEDYDVSMSDIRLALEAV